MTATKPILLSCPSLIGWELVSIARSYPPSDPAFQPMLDELDLWPNPIKVVLMPNGDRTIWELREPGKWPVEQC